MTLYKKLRLYFLLLKIQVKVMKQYPLNLVFGIVSTMIWHLPGFFLLWIVINDVPVLSHWSHGHLVLLYGLAVFGDGVQHLLFESFWSFGNKYIRNGEFDRLLIRPVSEIFQIAGSRIDIDGLGGISLGLFASIYSFTLIDMNITFMTIIFLICALISSAIIYCSLNFLTASTAFWIVDNFPVTFGAFQFHTLNKFPINFYPRWMQLVITWILPTSFATFYPMTAITGIDLTFIGYLSLPFALLFLFLSWKVWNAGIKKYQGTGS